MAPDLRAVQRVAVRGRLGSGRMAEGWVRHGEPPLEAARRVVATALGGPDDAVQLAEPSELTSEVVDLPDAALRVHVLGVGYHLGPASAGLDGGRPVPALFDELPPVDLLDHLEPAGPAAGQWLSSEGSGVGSAGLDVPVKVQRAGAYALLADVAGDPPERRILLTRLAHSSRWTLPGGGIDFGEHPADAVRREVHEETGLAVTELHLLDVGSAHWIGRAPYGRLEDFHSVQVLYAGSVPDGSDPVVVEVDGSTDLAAWVPLIQIGELNITGAVRLALHHLRRGEPGPG